MKKEQEITNVIKNLSLKPGWEKFFLKNKIIIKKIFKELDECEKKGDILCPSRPLIFKSFQDLDISDIKVVYIGEDPYPNLKDAIGKSFLYPKDIEIPKSAKKIKEKFEEFLGGNITDERFHEFLEEDSTIDTFFLNRALTIGLRQEEKNSKHFKIWECFYEEIIKELAKDDKVIFVLLGSQAIDSTEKLIENKNNIVKAGHPANHYKKRLKDGTPLFEETNIFEEINNKLNENYNLVYDKQYYLNKKI